MGLVEEDEILCRGADVVFRVVVDGFGNPGEVAGVVGGTLQ